MEVPFALDGESGTLYGDKHKFIKGINVDTGEEIIIYCNGNFHFIEIPHRDFTWNDAKTKFTTKRPIKNLTVTENTVSIN